MNVLVGIGLAVFFVFLLVAAVECDRSVRRAMEEFNGRRKG